MPLFPTVVNIYVSGQCHSSHSLLTSMFLDTVTLRRWCVVPRSLFADALVSLDQTFLPSLAKPLCQSFSFSVCSQISVSFDTFIKTTATTLELCVHLCRRGLSARGLRLLRLQSHRRTSTRPSVVIWDLSVSSSSREGKAEGSDGILEEGKEVRCVH